jgi:hypothetical protein
VTGASRSHKQFLFFFIFLLLFFQITGIEIQIAKSSVKSEERNDPPIVEQQVIKKQQDELKSNEYPGKKDSSRPHAQAQLVNVNDRPINKRGQGCYITYFLFVMIL